MRECHTEGWKLQPCVFELVLPVWVLLRRWGEGGRRWGGADTPRKGTFSQGTTGPVIRRQNSHNRLSASRTEGQATGCCRPSPSWPPPPPYLLQHHLPLLHYLQRVRVTFSPLGFLQTPPLPLLHCHLSHAGKCLTLFDGCGFPRQQRCKKGQKTLPLSFPGWTLELEWRFRADNLRGAPFSAGGRGNWRGQDILCDAPECAPHQAETKRAPFWTQPH